MKEKMKLAIQNCLDAALEELDVNLQKKLLAVCFFSFHHLKCASYGRTFSSSFENASFLQTCQLLKILNLIRQHGFTLTYKQFKLSINLIDIFM
jgi:hypothetical protein